MFDRISRLFHEGRIDKNGLANAVEKKLITAEEFESICNLSYTAYLADVARKNENRGESDGEQQ